MGSPGFEKVQDIQLKFLERVYSEGHGAYFRVQCIAFDVDRRFFRNNQIRVVQCVLSIRIV